MAYSEQVLIDRSKAGDVAAFEELISVYQKKIYNLTFRMLGNLNDADDLTQETFIRVFKSISNFKGESTFSTWIYRIATNVCLDELRKRKNKKAISLDEEIKVDDGEIKRQIESDTPLPDEIAEKEELRLFVKNAIESLPEEQRLIISLRDIQGLSYDEIAQVLECPSGTVKSRINRARQALKKILISKRELLDYDFVKNYERRV